MQPPPFLPDDLGEWLGAITIVVGAISTLVVAIYRYGRSTRGFEDEVKALEKRLTDEFALLLQKTEAQSQVKGERFGRIEDAASHLKGRVDTLANADVAFGLEVSTNTREISRIGQEVSGIEAALKALAAEVAQMNALARERIATLEERTASFRMRKPPQPE